MKKICDWLSTVLMNPSLKGLVLSCFASNSRLNSSQFQVSCESSEGDNTLARR